MTFMLERDIRRTGEGSLALSFGGIFDLVAWADGALCAQADPEAWFPEKGGSTAAAKRICQACPVQQECLERALARDERFGVWGGLSERQRREVRRQRELAA